MKIPPTVKRFGARTYALSDGGALIELEGPVDLESSPQFREALFAAIGKGATRVIVDLNGVHFIDSTAMGVLMVGARELRRSERDLEIVCARDSITRLLEITGLSLALNVHRSVDQALRHSA